ncbi:MAG: proline--tRNA ligase, partial [Spirochaetales bacterium]
EIPAEAVIASHQLMLRAGFLRKLGNGLFAYLPLGLRSFRKVENIVREEMDRIGSLECKPSVVVPGELWRASGRWDTMGDGLLRAKNRLNQELVVSPTAEEAFTAMVRDELSSYKQLPLSLYQINTKYRDEIRPRYGVMRGREFTMKDAYSFHATQESLDEVYNDFAKAYRRVFKRLALTVIPVSADSGAMGGNGSEEFMVESAVGDDTLILCPSCGYAANTEKAVCAVDIPCDKDGNPQKSTDLPVEEIHTPDVKTIDELCAFLNSNAQCFIKTLIYKLGNCKTDFIAVCIRGDLDVSETKLAAFMQASEAELAADEDLMRLTNAPMGFAGPVGLTGIPVIADTSVTNMHDAVTGGLKKDVHLQHVEPNRDFTPDFITDLRVVVAGDTCADCSCELYSKKGNELGHIFKLGKKYTESMSVTYLDENGKQQIPTMGCYGIGIDRALASIIEEHHDDKGIIWPMTCAPYHVAVIPIKYDGAMKENADKIYDALQKLNVEVILDDRNERPGVKFNDAELLGIPVRIVIGDKNLPNVEVTLRSDGKTQLLSISDAIDFVSGEVKNQLSTLNDISMI